MEWFDKIINVKKESAITFLLVALASIIFFSGCNSVATKSVAVENRLWTNTDSELFVDSLVNQFVNSRYLNENFKNSKTIIVVGKFANLTDEKIDEEFIEKSIERRLLNSGKTTFISDKSKRELARSDRKNASDFESNNNLNMYFKSLNLDCFISGKIELVLDSTNMINQKKYIFSLEALDTKKMDAIFNENIVLFK